MVGDYPVIERAEHERPDDQSVAEIFEVLSDRHRRQVLRSLQEHGQEIAIADLAADLAGGGTGPSRSEVPPQVNQHRMEGAENRGQNVAASLYHVHIPKLEDAGVVTYDPDRGIVRSTDATQEIQQVLALTEPRSQG